MQTKLSPLAMARELLTGRKILLVEDDAGLRSLLTTFLFRYGALVTAYTSISAAIDSGTRARPDLVITDIGLSDRDGFQLLRVIKKLDLESGYGYPSTCNVGACRFDIGPTLSVALPAPQSCS